MISRVFSDSKRGCDGHNLHWPDGEVCYWHLHRTLLVGGWEWVGGEEYDVEEVGEDEDSVLDEGWDGNLPPAARAVLVRCYTMCEQVEDKSRVHRFFCQWANRPMV